MDRQSHLFSAELVALMQKPATDQDTMHPGLWLAFGDISGQDFWRNKGRIEHVRFSELPQADKERLTFATALAEKNGGVITSSPDDYYLSLFNLGWEGIGHWETEGELSGLPLKGLRGTS